MNRRFDFTTDKRAEEDITFETMIHRTYMEQTLRYICSEYFVMYGNLNILEKEFRTYFRVFFIKKVSLKLKWRITASNRRMLCTKGVSYYRKYFCVTFGGWHVNTRSYSDEENVFHRVVRHPSDDMRRKAVAYYRVCYGIFRTKYFHFHSFIQNTCLLQMLDAHNTQYCEANRQKFLAFAEFREGEAIYSLKKYTRMYKGGNLFTTGYANERFWESLDRVLFIVSEWADKSDLFCRRLQSHHLSLLVILFAINYFSSLNGNAKRFIDEIDDDVTLPSIEDKTMVLLFPSQLIVSFFEFLASRSFRKLDHLSFNHLGYNSVFLRGEWIPIHTVFTSFFYKIVEQFIIRELLINAKAMFYFLQLSL
uniref:DUF7752 domain-containing protein n=1 Tax=Heterorhabditis bacteriophora TaxID=37862 RepID=A0A1I7WEF9_HETBA